MESVDPIDLRPYCYPKQTGLIDQVCPDCNAYIIFFWDPKGRTFAKCLVCNKMAQVMECNDLIGSLNVQNLLAQYKCRVFSQYTI